MMDAARLQDRIDCGMGAAARAIGAVCDAYRPSGPANPLASGNRFLQLAAAFNAQDGRFRSAGAPDDAIWYGVFDAAYLQAGDYLVEQSSGTTWFVGALQSLLPPSCVRTNRVVSLSRPGAPAAPGLAGYGGGAKAALPVLTGFPASLLHGSAGRATGPIPADTRELGGVLLLPPLMGLLPSRGDMVSDDLQRRFVVGSAEMNVCGWRLDIRAAAS